MKLVTPGMKKTLLVNMTNVFCVENTGNNALVRIELRVCKPQQLFYTSSPQTCQYGCHQGESRASLKARNKPPSSSFFLPSKEGQKLHELET
jgi:hypothetical protein